MVFTEILKSLAERTRATGAVMMDRDGEIVASWAPSDLDMELVGAHFEIVLDAANDAATRHGGQVGSMHITAGASSVSILPMKEGYCLVVAAGRDVHRGKVMLEAAGAVSEIEAEMG